MAGWGHSLLYLPTSVLKPLTKLRVPKIGFAVGFNTGKVMGRQYPLQ